ncbi:MAG TPA: porin [Candidatus Binatia bacterium]|nr:porin [Candidatus Binatia bacterium]
MSVYDRFIHRAERPGATGAPASSASRSRRKRRFAAALVAAMLIAGSLAPPAAVAGSPRETDEVRELRQRVEELEKALRQVQKDTRTLEVAEEVRTKAKPNAGYKDGFFLNSDDGKYKLKVGGYVHADSRWALDHHSRDITDGFSIRRARLDIRGTLADRFEFRVMPDFAGSSLVLQDAYVDWKFALPFILRVGKMKTPFGIERLQSATALQFMERALTDNLVPNRDLGVQLYGDIAQGVFSYQAGVFNGVVDGGSTDVNLNDAVDLAARVFSHPFRNTPWKHAQGLGLGVAGSWGEHQGTPANSQLPQFRTSSRAAFFRYRGDDTATAGVDETTVADGAHWRVSPQAYWYAGPFSALGEYVYSSQQIRSGTAHGTTQNDAWQARVGYVLTGEDSTYKGVTPSNPFNFGNGGWGAWELALRASALDVDDDTFRGGFASAAQGATEAQEYTLALNWYVNKNVAVYFNYLHGEFEAGRSVTAPRIGPENRKDEDAFLTRVQFVF